MDHKLFHFMDINRGEIAKTLITQSHGYESTSGNNGNGPQTDVHIKSCSVPFMVHVDAEILRFTELQIHLDTEEEAELFLSSLQKFQLFKVEDCEISSLVVYESEVLDVGEFLEKPITPNKPLDLSVDIQNNDSQLNISKNHISPALMEKEPLRGTAAAAKVKDLNALEKNVSGVCRTAILSKTKIVSQNRDHDAGLKEKENRLIFDVPFHDDYTASPDKALDEKDQRTSLRRDIEREARKLQSPIRFRPKANPGKPKISLPARIETRRYDATRPRSQASEEKQGSDPLLVEEMEDIRKNFSRLRRSKTYDREPLDAVSYIEMSSDAKVMSDPICDYGIDPTARSVEYKTPGSLSKVVTTPQRKPLSGIDNHANVKLGPPPPRAIESPPTKAKS